MGEWLDDFVIMQMMEEESEENLEEDGEEESEENAAAEELLEALQEELSTLQDELFTVECNEPADGLSDVYTRWSARRDFLEEQIAEVESAIYELEE